MTKLAINAANTQRNSAASLVLDAELQGQLRGELRCDEPMTKHTSWAVGGPAEYYFRPADVADLQQLLAKQNADLPISWVGLGSNLLVRDGGIPGLVVATNKLDRRLQRETETSLLVGAGVSCTKLARQTADWGLAGGAFFAGIPGLLGGALAMNAGAHGGETWDRVSAVQTINRAGELRWRDKAEFTIGYRSVQMQQRQPEWFLAAKLAFTAGSADESLQQIRELQAARAATQPIDQRSCGSVFRNPPGDHAARLIEAAGLKGHRIGGAEVSSKHANFIINAEQARAADIEALIGHVHATVLAQHGVDLIAEVRVIGEPATGQATERNVAEVEA